MKILCNLNRAQHRVHRTSAGRWPHFQISGPNGGFGVWWFFPPSPALAGNASRWALDVKVAILLVGESVSAAARRLSWPKFSRGGGDERVSSAAFSSADW